MNPVYIIDFSNFAYKFKSVYKFAKIELNGVTIDTSVFVGFIRCLKSNISKDIVIVLDGVPSRSLELLPGYKGQRSHDETSNFIAPPKIETIQFLTKIGTLLHKNISVLCSPMQETDEVIASLVYEITKNLPSRAEFLSKLNSRSIDDDKFLKGYNHGLTLERFHHNYDSAVIGSTDGDFIQLQRFNGVSIDTSSSGRKVSSQRTSKSTAEVSPIASIVYKAIFGDASDNIPQLPIAFTKQDILPLLNIYINTEVDLLNFKGACIYNTDKAPKGLRTLANHIYKTCKKQFDINWTVAFLEFRSFPLKLSYPDYNIEETLKKYDLKV